MTGVQTCALPICQKNSGFRSIVDKLTTPGVAFKSPVPQANLREFYNQSSVFVLASVADGFAMVVLQAMACELPVIITENVGASELIEDGVNGFVEIGRASFRERV